MVAKTAHQPSQSDTQAGLSVKYNTVTFPVDVLRLVRALSQQGYSLPGPLPPLPPGGGLQVSGADLRKGDVTVRLDGMRLIMGVAASSVETVLQEFVAIESIMRTDFGIDSGSIAHFYELVTTSTTKAGSSPLEAWSRLSEQDPLISAITQACRTPVAKFGERFTPPQASPNSVDWFDIKIEPSIMNPSKEHWINVVFRNSNRGTVLDFGRRYDETVRKLIQAVERS